MYAPTRRNFIRQAACAALTASGLLNTIFDLRRLSAATIPAGTDYKALVCLFLFGGNDANNVIVPHDASGYAASYADAREASSRFLRPLFFRSRCRAATVAISVSIPTCLNCRPSLIKVAISGSSRMWGHSVAPSHAGSISSPQAGRPFRRKLFSHADQSVQWQTSVPDQPDFADRMGWDAWLMCCTRSMPGSQISLNIWIAGTNTLRSRKHRAALQRFVRWKRRSGRI